MTEILIAWVAGGAIGLLENEVSKAIGNSAKSF